MRCGLACLYERRNVRKDLARWSRTTLLATGIENIACHLVGKEVWEAIFPESSVCLNQPVHFSGSVPADFVPAELCLLCDRQRTEAATESVDKKVVMCDSDSGVCSASPPTSPRASQPVPSASTEATLLCMTSLYERTREAIMRMQAAQQFEMMSQMQMLGLLGMAPAVAPEINRIMFENQLAAVNPFLASPLWNLHAEPSHPPFQPPAPSKPSERNSEVRTRDEQPLDLSRKSGLEAIIDIETSNYNQKQRKQSQPQSETIEKETNGQEEIVRNGYGIKRNYSQVDLTAAVNDIRCGRLGTRRASVVYGIPRSTLRNKIYKLEAAEEQAGQAPLNKRRRPGGQSNAEKKLAEQVERQKKASTPVTDCSSISPSSDGTDGEKTFNADNRWENDWTTNLWQSLFNQNSTSMTADVMGTGGKEDGKKEELSEWKKSRPKRGQYRKYDKNALDEAVRSVRRGEMSVHRAGSYYGVPHSTLEYKVKERNLLRKKKDSPPVKEISLMQEPMTSLNISEESSSPVIAV
uniref:HTH psq-type domain-containing protein n=1 Tax=Haemonchus contortus TaxID=6289 RepID=A0A7I5EEJ9_HAECO